MRNAGPTSGRRLRDAVALFAVVTVLVCPASSSSRTHADPVPPLRCAPGVAAWPDCTLWNRTPSLRWLAPDLAVGDVAFGITRERDDSAPEFVETRVVPYAPGQLYGWSLALRTGRDRVRVREELTLPARPATWGRAATSPLATTSADGRRVVVEEETELRRATRFWSIDKGDPRGLYELRLYVEDVLVGEATFIVGEPRREGDSQ